MRAISSSTRRTCKSDRYRRAVKSGSSRFIWTLLRLPGGPAGRRMIGVPKRCDRPAFALAGFFRIVLIMIEEHDAATRKIEMEWDVNQLSERFLDAGAIRRS